MKKILVIALALISGNLFAGFNWGGNCDSGNDSFNDSIPYRQTKTVGDIPLNKKNIRIELNSEVDVDVQLVDLDNNKEIIAWPNGLLSGATEACTTYEGVEYCYSGYNGTDGKKGHEWIEIHGVTNHKLRMKAFGYESGNATINYSWKAVDTCNEKGNGNFNQYIPYQNTIEVGKIPAGKVNVRIDLTANNDVDVQLWDGTKPIIAWSYNNSLGALLYGASKEQTTYKNMTIIYSGYNGVNGNPGKEFIEIKGEISTELTMKAFGYASGNATVDYSWGNGAGDGCGYGRCKEGLFCKTHPQEIGHCHTKNWCLNDNTAKTDCRDLIHIAVPGRWTCKKFQCHWNTSLYYPICGAIGTRSEGWYWDHGGSLIKWDNCKDKETPKVCGEIITGHEITCASEGDGFMCYKPEKSKIGICLKHQCQNIPLPNCQNGTAVAKKDNFGCIISYTCQGNTQCGGIAGLICPENQFCQMDANYPDAMGTCKECPIYDAPATCPEGTHHAMGHDSNGCAKPICEADTNPFCSEENSFCGEYKFCDLETHTCKECPLYSAPTCPEGTHHAVGHDSNGCAKSICVAD